MTTDDKLDKILNEEAFVAYVLQYDDPAEDREEVSEQLEEFRDMFDECVEYISDRRVPASYIERKYSTKSPGWAPMGLYADWEIDGGCLLCVFMGGDGNPEEPFILLGGRTTQKAKTSRADPWMWKWIET